MMVLGSAITYYETVIKYGLPDLGYLHLKLSLQLYHDLLDDKEEAKHSIYRQFWKEEQKQYGKEQVWTYWKVLWASVMKRRRVLLEYSQPAMELPMISLS